MAETTEELFEKAVRLHSRRLLGIARGIVGSHAAAEDVLQQAIVNLYEHRERYNWREPVGLMRKTVVNEALRTLRTPRMGLVGDDRAGKEAVPGEGMEQAETVERVRTAIGQLPDHFRAALVLCEYEGMSYVEIAEVLEVTIPQVKTWLHRGRRQLAEKLKEFVEGIKEKAKEKG